MNGENKTTILYVEDEECTLRTTSLILSSLGFDVIAIQSSIEALNAFSQEPERYDLVITDHNMPNLTGCDLSERLLEIRPDIPIILCTGYSLDILTEQVKTLCIKAFITKPITVKVLDDVIRQVLNPA